jgi:hypothetical protein
MSTIAIPQEVISMNRYIYLLLLSDEALLDAHDTIKREPEIMAYCFFFLFLTGFILPSLLSFVTAGDLFKTFKTHTARIGTINTLKEEKTAQEYDDRIRKGRMKESCLHVVAFVCSLDRSCERLSADASYHTKGIE